MSSLLTRITKLERLLDTSIEAELRAMSDEELERRSDECLREMSEEDVRAMAREYPELYTPEHLEAEFARWRRLRQNIEDNNRAPKGSARARPKGAGRSQTGDANSR